MKNVKLYEEWSLDLKAIFNKEYTYVDAVKNHLHDIICDEKGVSEKSFKKVDQITDYLKKYFLTNQELLSICDEYSSDKKRPELCAEIIYYENFSNYTISD